MAFVNALLNTLPDIDTAPLWQVQAMFLIFIAAVIGLAWLLISLLMDRHEWKRAEAERSVRALQAIARAQQDASDRRIHRAVRGDQKAW
jgi:hypothetical protein